jgi:hypothetical protein
VRTTGGMRLHAGDETFSSLLVLLLLLRRPIITR